MTKRITLKLKCSFFRLTAYDIHKNGRFKNLLLYKNREMLVSMPLSKKKL